MVRKRLRADRPEWVIIGSHRRASALQVSSEFRLLTILLRTHGSAVKHVPRRSVPNSARMSLTPHRVITDPR